MKRRLVDTNLIVRYLAQDHETHAKAAGKLFDACDKCELVTVARRSSRMRVSNLSMSVRGGHRLGAQNTDFQPGRGDQQGGDSLGRSGPLSENEDPFRGLCHCCNVSSRKHFSEFTDVRIEGP
ncbi:MAG TPA: hypothetical protein VJ731_15105 [Terriglobales bacterium]|nr:hypothetical protein [Terriglobales bacterium]